MNPFASWWRDFLQYTGQSSLFLEGFWLNEWEETNPLSEDDDSDNESD
jgi:hypothetical protein